MKKERMSMIMKITWTKARKLAKELGGKPVEYIREVLKEVHREAKENMYIMMYNKKEDDYTNTYVIVGTNPIEKVNKQGGKYLAFTTFKGLRNYTYYNLIKCTNYKDMETRLVKLLKENPNYILVNKENSLLEWVLKKSIDKI